MERKRVEREGKREKNFDPVFKSEVFSLIYKPFLFTSLDFSMDLVIVFIMSFVEMNCLPVSRGLCNSLQYRKKHTHTTVLVSTYYSAPVFLTPEQQMRKCIGGEEVD